MAGVMTVGTNRVRPPASVVTGAFGSPGFNNARAYLAGRGVVVGRAAQAATPGAQKMSWRDVAQRAGISDFAGAKKDPRFRDLQDAFYGHADTGGVVDPQRQAWKDALLSNLQADPAYGGAGGGTDPAGGAGGAAGGGNYASQIPTMISDLMSGKLSPYGQDTIDRLKASAFEDAAGGVEAAKRGVAQRAARTGGLYSASAGSAAAQAEQAGRTDVSNASRQIEQAANEKNFEARQQGLQQGLALLAQEREERMANARNEVERESIRSQYDGLIKSTQLKIDADREALDKQLGANAAASGAGYRNQREILDLQHQWDLENRNYEEQWRLFNALNGGLGDDGF